MCQTSGLISQTKAGEFDFSEFRSFVPMNKTSPLLDVTRTYQVTDSPLWARLWHSAGTPAQTEKKMKPPNCISSALAAREDNRTDAKIYRYVQHTPTWWRLTFDRVLMNNTLGVWRRGRRKAQKKRERKVDLWSHLISSRAKLERESRKNVQKLDM